MTRFYYEDFSLKFFLAPILGDDRAHEENVMKSFNLNKLIGKLKIKISNIKKGLKGMQKNLKVEICFFVDTNTENLKDHLENLKNRGKINNFKIKKEFPICEESKITIFEVEVDESLNIIIFNFDGKKEKSDGIEHSIEGLIENCLIDNESLKFLFKCFHGKGENTKDVEEEFHKHVGQRYYNKLVEILYNKLIPILEDCRKDK